MSDAFAVELTREQVATIYQWASDAYTWQERLRHDCGGRNTVDALRLYNEAWHKGSAALRIMCLLQPAREAFHATSESEGLVPAPRS